MVFLLVAVTGAYSQANNKSPQAKAATTRLKAIFESSKPGDPAEVE